MGQRILGLFSIVLIVVVLIGAGYWYRIADSTCPAPLSYSIGSIDERFGLSKEEAQKAVGEAEVLWENAIGRDLFIYDPAAPFTVNFIFDERQKLTVEEHKLRSVLDRKEEVSSAIKEKYEELLAKYKTLADAYETKVASYENALAKHNGEIAYWNNQGGAPSEVYTRLNEERRALDTENKQLGTLADNLNELVDAINELGEEGNETVQDYNEHVAQYNSQFHHEREFTQGDYYRERINIYQFKDRDELHLVLAHELGHALSLGHVEDRAAVMYYLMDEQDASLSITAADIAEFARVCGE